MGDWGFLWFPEEDIVMVEEIAKLHGLSKELVLKHYKIMLENIRNEIKK